MKPAIKKSLGLGCRILGIGRLVSVFRPGRFVVLMFHRVVDAATLRTSANGPLMVEEGTFAALARTLSQKCLCLPLAEARQRAKNGSSGSKPVVAVTFDDGYGDCYDRAFPILTRFGIPATIYLSTGYLDAPDRLFWWDAVEQYFQAPQDQDKLQGAGLHDGVIREVASVAASRSPRCVEAFIRGPLRSLAPEQRHLFLALAQRSATSRPSMLTWDQVREMAGSGLVDFGAHTVNHPFLDEVDHAQALEEIQASKRRVEEETDRRVTSFAYPSGHVPQGYGEMLSQAGIGLAVTTRFGSNGANGDPLLLQRIDARLGLVGDEFASSYFMALCWGCLDWLH